MAVGDSGNMLFRLKSLIPGGWFQSLAPIRDAVLGGLADSLAANFDLLSSVRAMTRIGTSTGWILDLIAFDFFGAGFLRLDSEPDDAWRARIISELLRERVTRAGLTIAVQNLTGQPPKIIELFNPGDCGGWDTGYFAWADVDSNGNSVGGAGCLGSTDENFQVFLTVYRPPGEGTPYVGGYDSYAGGFDVGSIEWTSTDPVGVITDADIYAAIARTAAAGVTCWVSIVNADNSIEQPFPPGTLDFSTPLNSALLALL